MRVVWTIAGLLALALASPLIGYIDQAGPQVTQQVVEDFNGGHVVVQGALTLQSGYVVNEYGYYLPAHQSGTLYYRIVKPRGSGLALAAWVGLEPVNLPGTIAFSLDGGPFQDLAYDASQARKVLTLPAASRPAASVVLRISAQNRSANDRLVLDQLEWTTYHGSAVSAPSPLIPLGLGLLAALLAFAVVRPLGRWSAAAAACVGALTAYATLTRISALQAFAMAQLDPDAVSYRLYGERFQWWPPTRGLFCGCYSEREPFYPMLLHADFSLLGSSDFHVRVLSFLLSLAAVPLAVAAARRMVSWPWALAVGGCLALSAPLVGESSRGLRTELEMCLVLISFLVLSRALNRRWWIDAAGSGLAAAALVLTRSFFLPTVVVAVTIAMLARRRRRALAVAWLAVGLGLPLLAFGGHKLALYEVPHRVNYAALHDFNFDTNGYNRWNANVEKFDQGRPLPHPELFPTAEQYHRDGPYSGPPISTWQYLFVLHTPQEVLHDSLAGYLEIWRNTDGISLPGTFFGGVGPYLDLAVRWLGLAGLLGLVGSARRVPGRLLIPAIVLSALAFAAFPYYRGLTERYRHTYQVYPLFLVAAAWAGQVGTAWLWAWYRRSVSSAPCRPSRSSAAVGAAVAGSACVLGVVTIQAGNAALAGLAGLALLCLAAAAVLDAPIAAAALLAVLMLSGTRLGLLAATVVAAGAVAGQWRSVLASVPRLAPVAGPLLALVLAGAGGAAHWHPSRAAAAAVWITVTTLLAATAALLSPAGRVRLSRAVVITAVLLAGAAVLGTAAPTGTLPPQLGINGTLAAVLGLAVPLGAWIWRNRGGWGALAAVTFSIAVLMLSLPLLGMAAAACSLPLCLRPRRLKWPLLAGGAAAIVILGLTADALGGSTVPPGWRSYLATTQDTLVQDIDPSHAQGADRLFIFGRRALAGAGYHLVAEGDGELLGNDLETQLPTGTAGWIAIPLAGPPPGHITLRVTGRPNPGNAYIEVGGVYATTPALHSDLLVGGSPSRPDLSLDPGYQRGTLLILPGNRQGPFDFGLRLPGYGVRSPLDLPLTAQRAGETGAPPAAAAQASTLRLWAAAATIWSQHPILGTGIGSLAPQIEDAGFGPGLTARSQFLQLGAESGLLGVFALLTIVAAMAVAAARAEASKSTRWAILAVLLVGLAVQAPLAAGAAAAATWLAVAWVLVRPPALRIES